jgi:hypothetical protein
VSSPEASTLAHLAEMDKLLRDIQAELVPGREPAPALTVEPAPAPAGAGAPGAPAPGAPAPATGPRAVTVSAGPFASIEALREFEAAVARLPRVSEVALQAYEGSDRAILKVHLDAPH